MEKVFFKLLLATFLGALIGLERETKRKQAGLQTYSLVSLAACLFAVISLELFSFFSSNSKIHFDPSRVIQAVAVGMGFIGAGTIFRQESQITGLTTAAGLWITTAIGIAVGFGFYFLSIFSTFLILLILAGFGFVEEKLLKPKE